MTETPPSVTATPELPMSTTRPMPRARRPAGPDVLAVGARAAPPRRRDLLPLRADRRVRVRVHARCDRRGPASRGAERLILFHIVARGSCWVAAGDGERHWAHEGDVIVMPYGDRSHDRRGDAGRLRVDPHAARPAAVGGAPRDPSRRRRRADRPRVRLPALRRPAVRSRRCACSRPRSSCACPAARRELGAGQHRVLAGGEHAVEREREPDLDAAAGAGAHRGAPLSTSRLRRPPITAGSRRCATRCSRPRSSLLHAEPGAPLDGRRARGRAPRSRGRCSTTASGRSWASPPSAT